MQIDNSYDVYHFKLKFELPLFKQSNTLYRLVNRNRMLNTEYDEISYQAVFYPSYCRWIISRFEQILYFQVFVGT